MAAPNRREVLQQLLTGLVQATGAATVVLATASAQAEDEKPVQEPQQGQPSLEQRAEEALANAGALPSETGDEDCFVNGAFRNGGGGGAGFRNAGFANGGGFRNAGFTNGGFRNGGFVNGAFANGGFRNGGFVNGAFRNF